MDDTKTIQGNYTITYIDGHTDTATVTLGDRIKAEIEARRNKWGNIQDATFRHMAYAIWSSLHRTGRTVQDFTDWTFTVDDFDKTIGDQDFTTASAGSPSGQKEA